MNRYAYACVRTHAYVSVCLRVSVCLNRKSYVGIIRENIFI